MSEIEFEPKAENKKVESNINTEEDFQVQSQTRLIFRQFRRHKIAMTGLVVLAIFYFVGVIFPEFFAPHGKFQEINETYLPPQSINFIDEDGDFHLRPFVYNWDKEFDPETFKRVNTVDKDEKFPLYFFVRGTEYKLWGVFETDLHFVGVEEGGKLSFFGTDHLGRDLLSRVIYALRISLTIGLVGVAISLIIGLILGSVSAIGGVVVDNMIQRLIEIIMTIPKIPLWMGLAAAIPDGFSAVQVYFAITIILSFLGWTGVARVTRSKFISLLEEDFVKAAESYNTSSFVIAKRHLIPNFMSWVIVRVTLAIPGMILGETSLSFLGIGLRPPVVSLGVLLQQAQSFQNVAMFPWLLIPGLFVVIVVLAYNFVGDGLRDAADPYK